MPAIKRAARYNTGLVLPGLHHVVKLADGTSSAPEQMQRSLDTFIRISRVVDKIYRCCGTIVLTDGMDRFGLSIAAQVLFKNRFLK